MKKIFILGQSLYEVVFAIGIAAIIITGVLVVSTTSVRNSTYSKNNAQATMYAQEAIEWLRSERDASAWTIFAGYAGVERNLGDLNWASVNCTVGTTIFCRKTTLSIPSADTVDALVTVSWDDAQGTHTVRSVSKFTNWNK